MYTPKASYYDHSDYNKRLAWSSGLDKYQNSSQRHAASLAKVRRHKRQPSVTKVTA